MKPPAHRSSTAKIIPATSAFSFPLKAATSKAPLTPARLPSQALSLPEGYRLDWGGEYSELLEAKSQLYVIGPLAILLIFMILFALYGNFKFPVTIALGVVLTEPVGALIALKLTHTPFSVSSILGLLALLGVSVETAVILVSYINKLRLEGMDIRKATREASLLRLRPIMMTALVACLGLLPAAMSTGVGPTRKSPSPSSSSPACFRVCSSASSSTRFCMQSSPAKATFFRLMWKVRLIVRILDRRNRDAALSLFAQKYCLDLWACL